MGGMNEKMLGTAKVPRIILAIFRSPAKLVRKDASNSQSSLDHSGNLAVTNKIGTKRCFQQPKLAGSFWQSCGHQQNWYEKMLPTAKARWIILAILRSPTKLV